MSFDVAVVFLRWGMGEGHSSVSEVPSDVGELDRVRFRVDGEGGGESSSVELATEREVDDVFFFVGHF